MGSQGPTKGLHRPPFFKGERSWGQSLGQYFCNGNVLYGMLLGYLTICTPHLREVQTLKNFFWNGEAGDELVSTKSC